MTNQELVTSLRQLADFYEQNPSLPIPYELSSDSGMFVFYYGLENQFKHDLRALGSYQKVFGDPSPDDFYALKTIGSLKLKFFVKRDTVCTPRVVGKKIIERQVIPEQVIPAKVIEAREEEIIEWDCEPILAGPDAGQGRF